jgi:hypothetical protein
MAGEDGGWDAAYASARFGASQRAIVSTSTPLRAA